MHREPRPLFTTAPAHLQEEVLALIAGGPPNFRHAFNLATCQWKIKPAMFADVAHGPTFIGWVRENSSLVVNGDGVDGAFYRDGAG